MTTNQSAGLIPQDEVKRGSHVTEPKAPPTGGGEAMFLRRQAAGGVFEMDGKLIACYPASVADVVSFAEWDTAGTDWIMGMLPVIDDVSVHADYWERHTGDEVLCMLEGRLTVTLEYVDGPQQTRELAAGQAMIVPRTVWHRLDVAEPGKLLFLSSGEGSELRRVQPEAQEATP